MNLFYLFSHFLVSPMALTRPLIISIINRSFLEIVTIANYVSLVCQRLTIPCVKIEVLALIKVYGLLQLSNLASLTQLKSLL